MPPGGLKNVLTTPETVLTGERALTQRASWGSGFPGPSVTSWFSAGHTEKIYSLRFHPLAADVLASSSYDLTIRIWDLQAGTEQLRLQGHQDQVGHCRGRGPGMKGRAPSYALVCPQIFSLAWSPDGKQLATVCKDGRVRVYDPRSSPLPLQVSKLCLGQRQT